MLESGKYCMFCIPADSMTFTYGDEPITVDAFYNIPLAIQLANALGSKIYDLQLLPYCPLPSSIQDDNEVDLSGYTEDFEFNYITKIVDGETENCGFIVWCRTDNVRSTITATLPSKFVPTDAYDFKVANEGYIARLCSPNYAGAFEFTPCAALESNVMTIDVVASYRPYNPYIQLTPRWSKLYGGNYEDNRGLICQGDFSLPIMDSAWIQYQINNKNYNESFQNQIAYQEATFNINMKQMKFNAITGAVQGGVSGATAGALVGSVLPGAGTAVGAGIGAAAGAIVSGVGGKTDIKYAKEQHALDIDYAKDQFNFNLQNIQAMPNTARKTGAQLGNDKGWCFIELYECTDTEANAIRNKILYNGMTIGRIGTIADFIQETPSYIKGRLIRLELNDEDYHMVNEISNEIYQGGFI